MAQRCQALLKKPGGAGFRHQLDVRLGESDARRPQLGVVAEEYLGGGDFADQCLEQGPVLGFENPLVVAEVEREAGLEVDVEHAATAAAARNRQIGNGCGLAGAAFLVHDGDDLGHGGDFPVGDVEPSQSAAAVHDPSS